MMKFLFNAGGGEWDLGEDGGWRLRNIFLTGSLLASGSASVIGYTTGAGGTVNQAIDKGTAVTLNRPTGRIVLAAGAIAAGATTRFQVLNSVVEQRDTVVVHRASGGSGGTYLTWCDFVNAGSFFINVMNVTGASRDEQPTLQFNVIRGAST